MITYTNIMEKNTLIDFHAHILPGMDHGCDDVAMAMKQLEMAAAHKIGIIIAASHFYPHLESVEDFLKRREDSWMKLKAAKRNGEPVIRQGAEVLICRNIDHMEGIEKLCVEGSNVLLVEMPFISQWEDNLIETIVRLKAEKGLEVILAHGERYPVKEMEKLLVQGFQMQLNVTSITRLFQSYKAKKYIKGGYVTAFGSDIHGLCNTYKEFTKSMKKLGMKAERVMEKTRNLLGEE